MNKNSVAILVYGDEHSGRNALLEEKYSPLAAAMYKAGLTVSSVLYQDSQASSLIAELGQFGAILVWVNPIEQGMDRSRLDEVLRRVASNTTYVSAHPDTILKLGTKEILFLSRGEEFGSPTNQYHSFHEFRENFRYGKNGITILKQYRGNGGQGVFKVELLKDEVIVTEASTGEYPARYSKTAFLGTFKKYFEQDGRLIEQEWNSNIVNGMVRCYLSIDKVAGFGYQEINALYPSTDGEFRKPGKRYYYSENCGLFADLRSAMEDKWVPRLRELTGLATDDLPVIWDADFFINAINETDAGKKYTLCEINTSSVSPFPESAIPFIVQHVRSIIKNHKS